MTSARTGREYSWKPDRSIQSPAHKPLGHRAAINKQKEQFLQIKKYSIMSADVSEPDWAYNTSNPLGVFLPQETARAQTRDVDEFNI